MFVTFPQNSGKEVNWSLRKADFPMLITLPQSPFIAVKPLPLKAFPKIMVTFSPLVFIFGIYSSVFPAFNFALPCGENPINVSPEYAKSPTTHPPPTGTLAQSVPIRTCLVCVAVLPSSSAVLYVTVTRLFSGCPASIFSGDTVTFNCLPL